MQLVKHTFDTNNQKLELLAKLWWTCYSRRLYWIVLQQTFQEYEQLEDDKQGTEEMCCNHTHNMFAMVALQSVWTYGMNDELILRTRCYTEY